MSLAKPRRAPIPSAFMPPDWNPGTVHDSGPPSPNGLRSPTSSTRSTPPLRSDVFPPAASDHQPSSLRGERAATRSLRTSLRQLEERQVARRRARTAQALPNNGPCLPTPTSFAVPALPSTSVAQPVEVLSACSTPPVYSSSPEASLRSARNSLRRLKDRQAAEKLAQTHAEQHQSAMEQICAAETYAYEKRWECIIRRAQVGSCVMIRFAQIPWPTLTPIVSSPEEIKTRSVERFLLSPFKKPHLTPREKIEVELPRWTRDNFEESIIGALEMKDREDVRKGRQMVWTSLQELLALHALGG